MSTAQLLPRCLWTESLPAATVYGDEPPSRADVVIVGGGYTGLSAARTLARLGASAVVLERETLGWGASSRNGGMVLSGYKPATAAIARRMGDAHARALHALSLDSVRALEALIAEEGIACEYVRSGHLSLAARPSHFSRLLAEQQYLIGRLGVESHLLTPDEMRRELPTTHYHGALLDPSAGSLQPAKYVAGLAGAAARAGARLCERTEARRLARVAGGFSVTTSRGVIHARDVLIATNGHTGGLTPALRRRVVPIGSYLIATEPLPDELARELIPHRRVLSDTNDLLFYFRLSADNRMVFGGRASFTPTSVARSSAILRRGMVRVFPRLADVRVEHAWGGKVCFTLDHLPHAGRLDGLHFALGYCGHGVAMATYLGAWMGEVIAGRRELPPFAGHRFPAIPLYEGVPWFLPFMGAWFRMKDGWPGR